MIQLIFLIIRVLGGFRFFDSIDDIATIAGLE